MTENKTEEVVPQDLTPEMMEKLAAAFEENSRDYTLLKLAEECAEVNELCIKMVTKKGGIKEPSVAMLALEMGDLMIRYINALTHKELNALSEAIDDAMKMKYLHLFERIEKYRGKL